MTTKQALLDLATRVEALEGPDRSVDATVFRVIGAPVPFQFANKLVALTFDETEQCYWAPIGEMRVRYEPPAYTGSLDAAMTLVPVGYDWIIGRTNDGLTIHAEVGGLGGDYTRYAATPPLALTAASLRAIAEGMEE